MADRELRRRTTDDKPTVTLTPPSDPDRTSAFLNVRVADIQKIYEDWTAKGAELLTPPMDHECEIRAYVRDPAGHLIEVGQSKGFELVRSEERIHRCGTQEVRHDGGDRRAGAYRGRGESKSERI